MKVPFATVLKDLDGVDLQNGESTVTLGTVAVQALLSPFPNEQDISGEEKMKRYELALRVRQTPEEDFPVDEIAKIKTLIGKIYTPVVVGQAWKLLDGKT
jgi:hypothetical protein